MGDSDLPKLEYKLENPYIGLVMNEARHHIDKDADMCKCDKCYIDVCALILNSGFTKYVTTKRGALLTELDNVSPDKEMELMVAILKSIELVKKSPRH